MNTAELDRLTTDELWQTYEAVTAALATRIIAEKQALDAKLALLKHGIAKPGAVPKGRVLDIPQQKRHYPKVLQKYRNPQDHSQTWSGRGKQPHWVSKLLRSGAKLDDFVMPQYRRAMKAA